MPITLVIHGGAGVIASESITAYRDGLEVALQKGFKVLSKGGQACKAAMAAVVAMEDNPHAFNAGTGSALTRDGTVECDAALMLSDGTAGAVTALTCAKNPILIANKVRTDSPHVMLAGSGADSLVEEKVENSSLRTARMQKKLELLLAGKIDPSVTNTVGAVAIDERGNLASATSTGGVLGKWSGRVGDTPLIGAGTYSNDVVAVSCTGKGESFMRTVAAKSVALKVEQGERIDQALQDVLQEVKDDGGYGGIISVKIGGQVCVTYNSPMMAYGWKTVDSECFDVGEQPGSYGLHIAKC